MLKQPLVDRCYASKPGVLRASAVVLLVASLACWGACSAATRGTPTATVVANAAPSTLPAEVKCQDHAWHLGNLSLAEGRLLRARKYLEQARAACPEQVAEDLHNLAERIGTAHDDDGVAEHLQQAAAARDAKDMPRAWLHEAAAVLALERQTGEAFRITTRSQFDGYEWSREGRYLLLTGREQVSVVDSQTGALVARVPRLDHPGERGQYHARAQRLVQLTVSEMPCVLQVVIFDTVTGAEAKRLCGGNWAFNADGTRLAVSEIHGMADGAIMSLAILDASSLEVVHRIEHPGKGQGNISRLLPSADASKVALQWATGVSVVDLNTAQTWQVEAEPFGFPELPSFDSRLFWTQDGQVSVWSPYVGNTEAGTLASWSRADCPRPTAALSPSEDELAIGCGDVVWLWDLRTPPATAKRVKLDHQLFNLRWFRHGGALLIRLTDDAPMDFLVLDPKRRKLLPLVGEREKIEGVALATGLVYIEAGNLGQQGTRVVEIEADGSFDHLTLRGCRTWDEDIDDLRGTAVVDCGDSGGTWLFRAGQAPQHLKAQLSGRLAGATLVAVGYGNLELRSAADGSELPGSPEPLVSTSGDGYWQGGEFVAGLFDREHTASVHFSPTLGVRYSEAFVEECDGLPAAEHRGQRTWATTSPYPMCDRRSGTLLRKLPFPTEPKQFSKADVSDDGRFFLAQQDDPKLFDLANDRAVPLSEGPQFLQFAGNLLVGYTQDLYGVWDPSNGRRIARFAERGQLPLATSADLELALTQHSGKPLALYGFVDGKHLAYLDARVAGDVRFASNSLLSIVERDWVSFWRLPTARKLRQGAKPARLGRLLLHEGGAVYLAEGGQFEATVPIPEGLLRCEVGLVELPMHVCIEALAEPGLGAALVPR